MKNLLYKEFKLSFYPQCIIFLIFGFMMIIPNYPYIVGYLYVFVTAVYIFGLGRENNDIYYSCLLPVTKKDVVKARIILIMILEVVNALICIGFSYLGGLFLPKMESPYMAGMPANYALAGIGLFISGIFNLLFFPMFYKTGYKTTKAFLVSYISTFLLGVLLYYLEMIPDLKEIFHFSIYENLLPQIGVLGVGIVSFLLFTYVSYRISIKRFDKVDL